MAPRKAYKGHASLRSPRSESPAARLSSLVIDEFLFITLSLSLKPSRMRQPTLGQACSVSFLEDPSINKKHETGTRKHITPAISGFDNPLVWWGVRTHTFLQQHWHDRVPSVAYLPDVPVRSKADVNKTVEFLLRWACKCFVRFRVIVKFSSSQGCERRNLGPIELGDLTADYTFTTLTPARTIFTFAVLEIRAPGALDCFSLTESPSYNARRSDKGLDKHARA